MKQADADILFQYLKDIIFEKNVPMLSVKDVQPDYERFVQGMNMLHIWLSESSKFAIEIAEGRLNGENPSKDNPFCDSLKMLRSNLIHLVWQTKQVAKGDYSQQVAMLGEFSEAFNMMIRQLQQRENALLEQNSLLTYLTDNIGELVIVMDEETNEVWYENKAMIKMKTGNPKMAETLISNLVEFNIENGCRSWDLDFPDPEGSVRMLCYDIHSFYIDWKGSRATAHLIRNITEHKAWENSIEYAANTDALTGLYNRRYCMNVLKECAEEKQIFSLCFADLDRLKYVNDNFGHAYGDDYIKQAARLLKESFREGDVICRYGGDEFVIIVKTCVGQSIELRMEKVRERLEKMASTSQREYSMSISYGIIFCDENSELSVEEILSEADEKMYYFKQLHRK